MWNQRPHSSNGEMRPQHGAWRAGQNLQGWTENRTPPIELQREIQRLGSLLEKERARWFEENQKLVYVQRELEKTKAELQGQKRLKDMKRELLTGEEFSDSESLRRAIIASRMHSDIKHKTKRLLQKEFEQLKVAHIVGEEAFRSQIQKEKEKSDALQQELDQIKTRYEELQSKYEAAGEENLQVDMQMFYEEQIKHEQKILENLRAEKDDLQEKMSKEIVCLQETENRLQSELVLYKISYQELNRRYEADVSALREKADIYQYEVNCEKEANLERAKNDHHLINALRAEKNNLHQKMEQEFSLLQQQSTETIKHLQSELEQAKVSYQELQMTYEGDVSALRQQAEIFKQEVDKEMKAQSQKMMRDQKIISELGAEKDSLQKQLTVLQQRYCSCEVNYETELENVKTELQDRDELGPPRRKVARHQEPNRENYTIPVKTIYDPETMDLDHLLENIEFPDASPKELNDFVNEMLRDSSFLDPEAMEVTDLCVETLSEKRESQDPEPVEAVCEETSSEWKTIRQTLSLKKQQKLKRSKKTSKTNN